MMWCVYEQRPKGAGQGRRDALRTQIQVMKMSEAKQRLYITLLFVEKNVYFKTKDVSVFVLTPSSVVCFTPQEVVLAVIDP